MGSKLGSECRPSSVRGAVLNVGRLWTCCLDDGGKWSMGDALYRGASVEAVFAVLCEDVNRVLK